MYIYIFMLLPSQPDATLKIHAFQILTFPKPTQ